ncbi:MAG TPA: hypothetical protein VGO47_04035 [Chlamydiales bacterium]|jgi:hypothetical protein|nr:hypothetical protein [Chlamydiales bacterium]
MCRRFLSNDVNDPSDDLAPVLDSDCPGGSSAALKSRESAFVGGGGGGGAAVTVMGFVRPNHYF